MRLAQALIAKEVEVKVFLLGDGVSAAKKGQTTPQGYYNLEKMLEDLLKRKAEIEVCGTCIAARGIKEEDMIAGVKKSTMMNLATWIKDSQQVLTF